MNSTGSTPSAKGPLVLSLLIIPAGVGWLPSARGIGAEINWIWTLGLGVVGILTFVISGGLDKWSIIVGPFFLASSVLSILRQTGKLPFDTEVPVLVIFVGVLLLIAQTSLIPPPQWFQPLDAKKPGDR